MASAAASAAIKSVEFEVFGKVQGVFFRKYTKAQAVQQGLVGWVRNTSRGTVVGVVQGPSHKVELMKSWLSEVGSKASKIDKCSFTECTLQRSEYISFDIKR